MTQSRFTIYGIIHITQLYSFKFGFSVCFIYLREKIEKLMTSSLSIKVIEVCVLELYFDFQGHNLKERVVKLLEEALNLGLNQDVPTMLQRFKELYNIITGSEYSHAVGTTQGTS